MHHKMKNNYIKSLNFNKTYKNLQLIDSVKINSEEKVIPSS